MAIQQKLKENWKRYRQAGFLQMLLVEPGREKRRLTTGRSKIADIFLYSSSRDYWVLRFFYNFPIGFSLAFLVYQLAWVKINFACNSSLINPFWCEFVKWTLICCAALFYAFNSLVRAALICAILSGFSSTGQGLISVYVFEKIDEGPISNMLDNFNISTRITICHLEIQAKIAKKRIELQTGPMEALFEKHFGNATTIGKKVIKTLRSLIQPFDEEIEEHDTEEDEHLVAIIDTAKQLADRQLSSDGADGEGEGNAKIDRAAMPAWKRLKSQLGKAIAHRFTRRCELMFASSVASCHKRFEESQSLCYNSVPFPISYFTCSHMNSLSLCQANKVNSVSDRFCQLGQGVDAARGEHETLFSSELDDDMYGLQNVSKQIERQLQLNLHFQAVEAPEIERGYAISQLHEEVRHDVNVYKIIIATFRQFLAFLLIMFTYFVFRNCVDNTLKYLNDIEYKNFFTTRYFWRIDGKRRQEGKAHLRPLRKQEKKHNKITGPFGYPRADELQKMSKSFTRWLVVAFIAMTIVALDHYFYRMLQIIVEHGNVTRVQEGHNLLKIDVQGKGAIANLLRNVLNMNYSQELKNSLGNEHCLYKPFPPKWEFNVFFIISPLIGMLLLQVFFNFVVQRLVLFFVLGLIFPRRAKARIIHLYNKLLFARVNMNRLEEVDKEDEEQKKK